MKKLVLLAILGSLLSCNIFYKEEPEGGCSTPINAVIKEKKLIDGKEVYTIKTQNEYGWLYEIMFNKEDRHELLKNFINKEIPYTIKAEEFSMELIDSHTLKVTMDKNTTDKENTLSIGLELGNCFDIVEIVQPPREE